MSANMVALIGAIAAPMLAFMGVLVGAWKGRVDGRRQSEHATRELEIRAKIATEDAANDARREVTEAWGAYAESMQKDRKLLADRIETLEKRSSAAEHRLDSAETRAVIAEERATRWESLYRIAVAHLREMIQWATIRTGEMPVTPAELQREL
jgi:hypothetical protein